jgi:hypothetical protein
MVSAATSLTDPIVLARWCRDRRAGNGVLVQGSPPREMRQAVIWFVNRQSSCRSDIAPHARIAYAGLPGLEPAGDGTRHEHPTGLTDHIVYPIAVDLTIRTAETSPQEEAAIGVPVPSVRAFDRLNPNPCGHCC